MPVNMAAKRNPKEIRSYCSHATTGRIDRRGLGPWRRGSRVRRRARGARAAPPFAPARVRHPDAARPDSAAVADRAAQAGRREQAVCPACFRGRRLAAPRQVALRARRRSHLRGGNMDRRGAQPARRAGPGVGGCAHGQPHPRDQPHRAPARHAARLAPRAGRRPALRPGVGCSGRSEEHTSELQSHLNLVCRLLLEKKKKKKKQKKIYKKKKKKKKKKNNQKKK